MLIRANTRKPFASIDHTTVSRVSVGALGTVTGAGGRMDRLRSLVRNRDGATVVEYGLIAALISVGLLLGLESFSNELQNVLNLIAGAIKASWS